MNVRLEALPLWLVPALLSAVALMVVVRLMLPLVGSRAPEHLRDARLEEQAWRKRVVRLQHWQSMPSIASAQQSLEEVRLSVLESLDVIARLQQRTLDRVEIVQSVMPSTGSSDNAPIETLRVSIAGRFAHTEQLLALFERLRRDVPNWPAEVRACSIERESDSLGIQVACVYDIYYWPDPLTGGVGGGE